MADHGAPAGGECLICFDDLTEENYAEYRGTPDGPWTPALICTTCITTLRDTLYIKWVSDLTNTKCAAEQRRMLERGPPVNLYEPNGLPCTNDSHGEIVALWFMSGGDQSVKLKDSLEGQARLDFWEEQKKFALPDEPADATSAPASAPATS